MFSYKVGLNDLNVIFDCVALLIVHNKNTSVVLVNILMI